METCLQAIELGIPPAAIDQFLMGAVLDQAAILNRDDAVGHSQGRHLNMVNAVDAVRVAGEWFGPFVAAVASLRARSIWTLATHRRTPCVSVYLDSAHK